MGRLEEILGKYETTGRTISLLFDDDGWHFSISSEESSYITDHSIEGTTISAGTEWLEETYKEVCGNGET